MEFLKIEYLLKKYQCLIITNYCQILIIKILFFNFILCLLIMDLLYNYQFFIIIRYQILISILYLFKYRICGSVEILIYSFCICLLTYNLKSRKFKKLFLILS